MTLLSWNETKKSIHYGFLIALKKSITFVQVAEEVPEVLHESAHDPDLAVEIATQEGEDTAPDDHAKVHPSTSTQECQTEGLETAPALLSVDRIKNNPEMLQYYTSFDDYEHFSYVFQGLGPAKYHLTYQCKDLGRQDEFLLCLVKLRQDKDDLELGFLFGVNRVTAGKIFKTWLNFLYFQLKEVKLWVPKDVVEETMPEGFHRQFPSTRVILDATEVRIQKPSNVKDQRSTWSSYKNNNTLKDMIGITPRGVVSYVSPAYGGSASDRQIIENSPELFDGRFEKGDSIMADRGILVQDLFASQDVAVNTPTTMKGVNQLPADTVVKDRRIASKRVHVERVIGLGKTFKILQGELDHSKTPMGGRIIFVCNILSNFRRNIVPRFS